MYRLLFLGGLDVQGPLGPLSGRIVQPRPLALLALLARASGTPLTRDKAVGLLWPEVSERRARSRLSDALYVIRQELGSKAIVAVADRLRLDPGVVRSDVADFEEAIRAGRWERAVDLYAGPFLDGFHLGRAAEFERWAEAERRRLAEMHEEALQHLAEAAEARGDWAQAAAWWNRLAAEQPTDSLVAVRLMKALAAAGNVPRALEHARAHGRLLQEELGVALPEEVRALAEQLARDRTGLPVPAESGNGAEIQAVGANLGARGAGDGPGSAAPPPIAEARDPGEGARDEAVTSAPAARGPGHGIGDESPAPGPAARGPGAGDGGVTRTLEAGPSGPGAEDEAVTGVPEAQAGRPVHRGRGLVPNGGPPRWTRRVIPAGAVGLVLVAVLAMGSLLRSPLDGGAGAIPAGMPTADRELPSIVVLPFENLGPPEHEHFADGVTEELTVRLASVPGLRVIAPGTALQYAGAAADIPRIGNELKVDYALDGTVRWERGPEAEPRVRVTPRLVRVADGTHVWAETFERELAELFAVQTDIAERVAQELRLTLTPTGEEALARRPTGSVEAYSHYLQGNAFLARQFSREAARAAIEQYQRAASLDPGFAQAWRRLIQVRLWLVWVFGDQEQGRRALDDLERLLELDPGDPEVRLGRAWHLYYGVRRYEEALREFESVQASRPGDVEVMRARAFLQLRLGRWEESLATKRQALELSPRDAELAFAIGQALRVMGRFEEAIEHFERAFSLAPEEDIAFLYSNVEHVHLGLGDTLRAREARERAWELGAPAWLAGRAELFGRDFGEAVERILAQPVASLNVRLFRYDNLADAYGRLGDEERRDLYADSLLQLAAAMAPESWDRPRGQAAHLGWIYAGLARIHLGDPEAGIRNVERGLELEGRYEDALVGAFLRASAARAFVRAGRHDDAMEILESVASLPGMVSRYELRHDPEWEPLRDHPRFLRLAGAVDGQP